MATYQRSRTTSFSGGERPNIGTAEGGEVQVAVLSEPFYGTAQEIESGDRFDALLSKSESAVQETNKVINRIKAVSLEIGEKLSMGRSIHVEELALAARSAREIIEMNAGGDEISVSLEIFEDHYILSVIAKQILFASLLSSWHCGQGVDN